MISRRNFLNIAQKLCLSGLTSSLSASLLSAANTVQSTDNFYYQPAEWIERPLNIMIFPAAIDRYSDWILRRLRIEIAEIAKIISFIEPVLLLVRADDMGLAKKLVGDKVDLLEFDVYSHWVRDVMPSFSISVIT